MVWRIFRITLNFIIALFYITSVLGWVFANFMSSKGHLRGAVSSLYEHMTIFDHSFRDSQVILVFSASMALLCARKLAFPLFAVTLVIAVIANILQGISSQLNFGVSFLNYPTGIAIVAGASVYVFYQYNKGYLK